VGGVTKTRERKNPFVPGEEIRANKRSSQVTKLKRGGTVGTGLAEPVGAKRRTELKKKKKKKRVGKRKVHRQN